MTSQARIDANRRNAQKSTGPRTDEGKQKVRLNALKHGMDAQTAVLPHEDAAAYEKRREAWTRELSPGSDVGDYLAERAVKLSWQLDRADAHERAELARRVREVPAERERSRRRRVAELICKLLAADPEPVPGEPPALRRAGWQIRLESTAHGCRALLVAWDDVSERLSAEGPVPGGWARDVENRMLRLLGAADRRDAARSSDPKLTRAAALLGGALDRPASGPFDDDAARAGLLAVVGAERGRLLRLLERRQARQGDLPAEDAARSAFDRSKEGERVHRYQAQWGRALLQTLKAIAALGPAAAATEETPAAAPTVEEPEAAAPAAEAAPEQSQPEDEKALPDQELRRESGPRSRPGPGVVSAARPEPPAAGRIADLDVPSPPASVRVPAA